MRNHPLAKEIEGGKAATFIPYKALISFLIIASQELKMIIPPIR
jgi:hypothetical protein